MILQLIIVQFITFIGLVLVLRKILISSSYKETNRLQQLNEENAQKSQDLARKIADAENEYRIKMSEAEDQIQEMKSRARKEIDELKEAIIAKGKAEGDHIIAQALNSKKEMRAEIEEEMWDKSIMYSAKIFQKVLGSQDQKLVFDGLITSVLNDLGNIGKEQMQAIEPGAISDGAVEVKTSHSMNAAQKEKLEAVLTSKLGRTIKVREVVDQQVICGIIIEIGSFVIDGSLAEKFRNAAADLR